MIQKIIHQMFLGETGEKIKDFPLYLQNSKKWRNWANKNGYIYKFYTAKDIEPYLDADVKKFYNGLRYKWQRIDFSRYLVLNRDGGIYIDLDIAPTKYGEQHFNNYVENNNYLLNKWYNGKNGKWELNNALMGFPKGTLGGLINYSISETHAKADLEIYKKWKVRFMLHTTGVRMFKRWCKMNKLTYSEDIHKYVKDHCTASWLNNFK